MEIIALDQEVSGWIMMLVIIYHCLSVCADSRKCCYTRFVNRNQAELGTGSDTTAICLHYEEHRDNIVWVWSWSLKQCNKKMDTDTQPQTYTKITACKTRSDVTDLVLTNTHPGSVSLGVKIADPVLSDHLHQYALVPPCTHPTTVIHLQWHQQEKLDLVVIYLPGSDNNLSHPLTTGCSPPPYITTPTLNLQLLRRSPLNPSDLPSAAQTAE